MLRGNLLHFDLILTVAWVEIIENLLTARPSIECCSCVELLRNSHDLRIDRELQTQRIQSTPFQIIPEVAMFFQSSLDSSPRQKQNRAEVEIVSNAARLIIDQWVGSDLINVLFAKVRVKQTCTRILGDLQEAFQRSRA